MKQTLATISTIASIIVGGCMSQKELNPKETIKIDPRTFTSFDFSFSRTNLTSLEDKFAQTIVATTNDFTWAQLATFRAISGNHENVTYAVARACNSYLAKNGNVTPEQFSEALQTFRAEFNSIDRLRKVGVRGGVADIGYSIDLTQNPNPSSTIAQLLIDLPVTRDPAGSTLQSLKKLAPALSTSDVAYRVVQSIGGENPAIADVIRIFTETAGNNNSTPLMPEGTFGKGSNLLQGVDPVFDTWINTLKDINGVVKPEALQQAATQWMQYIRNFAVSDPSEGLRQTLQDLKNRQKHLTDPKQIEALSREILSTEDKIKDALNKKSDELVSETRNARAVLSLVSGLANLIPNENVKKFVNEVSTAAKVGISLYETIGKWRISGGSGLELASLLTGNVFGAALSILSGPSAEVQLLEAIRKDIADLRNEMRTSFEGVNKRIDTMSKILDDGLTALRADTADIKAKLYQISDQLTEVRRDIERVHFALTAYYSALVKLEEIKLLGASVFRPLESPAMTDREHFDYLNSYFARASSDFLTEPAFLGLNRKSGKPNLENVATDLKEPVYSVINFDRFHAGRDVIKPSDNLAQIQLSSLDNLNYLNSVFANEQTFRTNILKIADGPVPNAQMWLYATTAYLKIVENNQKFRSNVPDDHLGKMIDVGQSIESAVANLGSPETLSTILGCYRNEISTFEKVMANFHRVCVAKFGGNPDKSNLWSDTFDNIQKFEAPRVVPAFFVNSSGFTKMPDLKGPSFERFLPPEAVKALLHGKLQLRSQLDVFSMNAGFRRERAGSPQGNSEETWIPLGKLTARLSVFLEDGRVPAAAYVWSWENQPEDLNIDPKQNYDKIAALWENPASNLREGILNQPLYHGVERGPSGASYLSFAAAQVDHDLRTNCAALAERALNINEPLVSDKGVKDPLNASASDVEINNAMTLLRSSGKRLAAFRSILQEIVVTCYPKAIDDDVVWKTLFSESGLPDTKRLAYELSKYQKMKANPGGSPIHELAWHLPSLFGFSADDEHRFRYRTTEKEPYSYLLITADSLRQMIENGKDPRKKQEEIEKLKQDAVQSGEKIDNRLPFEALPERLMRYYQDKVEVPYVSAQIERLKTVREAHK